MRIDETMRVKEIMLRNMQNKTVRKCKTDMQEHQMEVKESQDPMTETDRKQSYQRRLGDEVSWKPTEQSIVRRTR